MTGQPIHKLEYGMVCQSRKEELILRWINWDRWLHLGRVRFLGDVHSGMPITPVTKVHLGSVLCAYVDEVFVDVLL